MRSTDGFLRTGSGSNVDEARVRFCSQEERCDLRHSECPLDQRGWQ